MGITVWPVDAVGGAPEYSGRDLRQALSPALAGATATRPLGALSGVRPGTPTDTVEVSGSTWTCHPHAGIIDGQSAAEAGPYWYAVDADVTGSVDAANATNPRMDLIYARISDPAESDGSTDPEVEILYLAGTAASSPTPPATPARSIPLAVLNVPKAGGGATTVTWVAPYMAAPGGIVYARTVAERNALAAAWGPTAENPLRVHRADAGAGRELEYTTDGSTWYTVAATPNWNAYTPSWTNLTVGNGTVTARWMVMAGMVDVELKLVLGSTSVVGSPPYFSLPADALPAAQYGTPDPLGHAFYAQGSSVWQGAVTRSGSFARCHLSNGGAPGGSSPFAWASGNVLSARLRYAVA